VSRRLAEHIGLGRDVRAVRAVLHGNYRQVRQTGRLIRQAMSAQHLPWSEAAALSSPCLDPARFWTEEQGAWRDRIKWSDPASDRAALLIVGREPQQPRTFKRLFDQLVARRGDNYFEWYRNSTTEFMNRLGMELDHMSTMPRTSV
jgi:hypothetical protein